MAEVIWTEPALQDLDRIADYIAIDKPDAAKKLIRKVFNKIDLLSEFPEMGSKPKDLPSSRYRHLVIRPLRIFHRLEGDKVYIIYVIRSEQDLKLKNLKTREAK